MDISDLESNSRSLEASLDCWGVVLLVATLAVVIGLVLEYKHEIKEFWIHWRWPMAKFPWDRLWTLSGAILVMVGVSWEFGATYFAGRVETKIRDNRRQIETLLGQAAADANQKAETLRQQNLVIESNLTKANGALERERKTRLELEASLRPREIPLITYTDGTTNIDDLKKLAGVEVILEYINDAEAGISAPVIPPSIDRGGI